MEEEIVRTRREVTETTEEDEDCQVFDAEQPREADSEERGRQLNRKTVTTTIRVTKRSTSRKRVKNKKQGPSALENSGLKNGSEFATLRKMFKNWLV